MRTTIPISAFFPVLLPILLLAGCSEEERPAERFFTGPIGGGGDYDTSLVGTWYRYSLTDYGANAFVPAKRVFFGNGECILYTYDSEGAGTGMNIVHQGNWTTSDTLLILTRGDGSRREGYRLTGGTGVFTTTDGFYDIHVKVTEEIDSSLCGSWSFISRRVDGEADPEAIEGGMMLNPDRTASWTSDCERKNGRWFVNGGYLVLVNSLDPDHDYQACRYELSEGTGELELRFYNHSFTGGDSVRHLEVASSWAWDEGERYADPRLAGRWHRYRTTYSGRTEGSPASWELIEDGTGVFYTLDSDTLSSRLFRWATISDSILVMYDKTGRREEWRASIRISREVMNLAHTASPDVGRSEVWVRGPGNLEQQWIGMWIPAECYTDSVFIDLRAADFFREDSTRLYLRDEEGVIRADRYRWGSVGDYLLTLLDNSGETLATVEKVEFSDSMNVAACFSLDLEGIHRYRLWVKQVNDHDSELVGTWSLESRTIDGTPDTGLTGRESMNLARNCRISTAGAAMVHRNGEWYTNASYLLLLPDGKQSTGQAVRYSLSGDTLQLEFRWEDGSSGEKILETYLHN